MVHAELSKNFGLIPKAHKDSNRKDKLVRLGVRVKLTLIPRPPKVVIKKEVAKPKKHEVSLGLALG